MKEFKDETAFTQLVCESLMYLQDAAIKTFSSDETQITIIFHEPSGDPEYGLVASTADKISTAIPSLIDTVREHEPEIEDDLADLTIPDATPDESI